MLSVIIPSFKDPYLIPTIQSLLLNAEGEIEIIPVLDGYWRDDLPKDKRVKVLHLHKNVGMRQAINEGIRIANGEFIMRTDEHCAFAKGFDTEMTSTCEPNWIMTAMRFFLDPKKWELMDKKPVIYERLKTRDVGDGIMKFEGIKWHERERERKDILIDETMAMQGSMWMMPKAWWEKIGELETEGYGPMYQDSHEMVFKTWKLGGKLMVNKNTWYAHKHVSFKRTHNYTREEWLPCVQYAYETWKDYFEEVRQKWSV